MTMNSPAFSAATDSAGSVLPADMFEPLPEGLLPVDEEADDGILDEEQTKAFNASKEGMALVAWVKEEYAKARDARRPYERQWYLNLAFYSGKQYVEWSKTEDKLVHQRQMSAFTPRLTINKIQPIIRTEQSKLTGQKPSATVMPSSNDDSDVFAAVAGEQVWESLYARLNFQAKLSRSVFWLSICGTSFMKTFWDPNCYDPVTKVDGDIAWLALSPLQVLVPDLTEPDLEMQPWVMDVQTRPTKWVEKNYGQFFPKGIKPTVTNHTELLEAAGLPSSESTKPDSTLIKEVWVKPGHCDSLPEGGMATVIDDTIVQVAPKGIPYDHKEFPFAKLEHIPSGRFYGMSTIESLIPLQREYNRTQSQIVEAKNRMGKPQVYYREGSMDPTKVTTEPGLHIPIKGSAEYPSPVPLTELPSYIVQFNDRMNVNFEDISGQHAPTRGEAPAGMAATAIAYLQEQDDAYLSMSFQSIEQAIQKCARHSLILAATYWTVPRLVKATGEDGGYDAMMLRGSDIAASTDIRIEHGSALPTSKSAKQAQVTEWMKFNWIDPNEGFELLDMPMLQQWVSRRKVDKKAAQRENIEFRNMMPQDVQNKIALFQQQQQLSPDGGIDPNTGAPLLPPPVIPVNEWDDHAIHIEIHNLWRKSPSYRMVPAEVRAEVEKHVQMHRQALAAQQMTQSPGMGQPGMMAPSPQMSGEDFAGMTEQQLQPPQ